MRSPLPGDMDWSYAAAGLPARHSTINRVRFRALQLRQAGIRLPIECRPPLEIGMMWSIVSVLRSSQ